jgi:hypothetical protein
VEIVIFIHFRSVQLPARNRKDKKALSLLGGESSENLLST